MFGSTHRWCVTAIICCALRWTANDPVVWEKAVGGSGEFGADWRDPLAFLGFLARTADAHKTRRKCEKDQVVCDLKTQLRRLLSGDSATFSCGGDERPSFVRDKWFFSAGSV